MQICVTGGAGFIGRHLVARLLGDGHAVVPVDVREPEFDGRGMDALRLADLRDPQSVDGLFAGVDVVVALAADIGGMGHISHHEYTILSNNIAIDSNTLNEAVRARVPRLVYASSACVYPKHLQNTTAARRLLEEDAWPSDPDGAYGAEKLWAEVALRYAGEEHGLKWTAARLHNIYGPFGTYRGGREKAPAAICRKVAEVVDGGVVELWGDGRQTRSFCFIEDCVEALDRLIKSEYIGPINVGSDHTVSIDELAATIAHLSGKHVAFTHVAGPQGVRGRSCDFSLLHEVVGWSPGVALRAGLQQTYEWIRAQVESASLEPDAPQA